MKLTDIDPAEPVLRVEFTRQELNDVYTALNRTALAQMTPGAKALWQELFNRGYREIKDGK